MKAHIKTSIILSFLLICLLQSHVNAQDFLKKFLSNSSIKSGKQLKTDGDYPSAITAFTKSIKREPQNLEAYYQLGLIFEEVLQDYDKAISLYKNVISLSDGIKPTGTDEELKEFNSLIANTRPSIDRAIRKKFESIEKPKVPVCIMVEPYKKILKEPEMFSYSIYKTTSYAAEFRLLDFSGNWYQVHVPSAGPGWVNGKDVLKIVQKGNNAIETSPAGKASLYQRFAELYPDSSFASEAKDKAVSISYELARDENTIHGYSTYLKKYPDSKYSGEVQLRKDELTFEDESFFNNISRLKHWMDNNSESTFIEKAKNRIEELSFAQAKYDNNTVSLERYIIDYPDGKFVSEAKQIIEDIKYNQTKLQDTIDSYKKYLDEYPDGRYVTDAAKRIDEKEFAALLNSQDIELLSEHVKSETNEERIKLVKNRIEELYFTRADKANNDAEAVKMHEDYLQKYPDGLYTREAEARIEELSFKIAARANTKDAYHDFIRKFPQNKYNQKAIDSIEVLEFNVAKGEDTIESFGKFLISHPNGKFAQMAKNRIEELALKEAKDVDTIQAYENFVKEYPDSHLATTAKGIIDTKYFENASRKGTVMAYKEYITLYPDGSHLEKARLIIDMLTFKPYDEKGSVSGFKEFIKKYPDNRFVEDARSRIDQLNFEYYQKKDTLKAYKKFIKKYPENRYVNEARQKIAKLALIGGPKSDKSSFWIWMAILHIFTIAIITLVILKRESILQSISHLRKKHEGQKKEQRIVVRESYNKNELRDEAIQKEAKMASEPDSTINSATSSKPETAIHGNIVAMTCPGCNKMVVPDKFFCTWCESFIPNPSVGKKSGLFRRWFATAIDPAIGAILYFIIVGFLTGVVGAFGGSAIVLAIVLATIIYGGLYIQLLSKGMTPGKWLLGEKVVEKLSGNYPGFWRMILREIIGKFVSGLPLALGYFWAIWDKDGQAWHDKIAGTVVVKRS
jgi:outer membrane protein assembly factor BamD (BamD/ComL family)/uncharacterized RDD family membrane protein YckC/heme exporter protein D